MPDSPTFGIFKSLYKGERGYPALDTGSDGLGYTCGKDVHTAGGGKGYTLHVHTDGDGKGYTLHVHSAGGEKGSLHVHTAGGGNGYTLHVHTAGSGNGIDIPASWSVRHRWSRISLASPS